MKNLIKTSYQFLPINALRIDEYQRTMRDSDMAWVKTKSEHFDETLLGTITVSLRAGKYYVIDGQHRVVLSKNMKRDGLMSLVYEGLTKEEEADYFKKLNGANGEQKKLKKVEILHASIVAKDEMALDIQSIANKYGFILTATSCDNSIAAIGTTEKIYKKYGNQGLEEVLCMAREIWDGERYSLNNQMLQGVADFLNTYQLDVNFNRKTFIRQLQKVVPIRILNEAKIDSSSSKMNIKVLNTLFKYYNSKLQKKLINQHYLLG